jgi:propanol-preferring alcohol dehydrogenase
MPAAAMLAWSVSDPGPIEHTPLAFVPKARPAPGPEELLVRVDACGVCRTDLHVSEGDLPVHQWRVTPGHEVVGTVAALGTGVRGRSRGDKVGVAWLRWTSMVVVLSVRRLVAASLRAECGWL